MNDKKNVYLSYFSDFECKWIEATKTHSKGRASGGCIFGIKKSIKARYGLRFDIVDECIVVRSKFNEEEVVFIPTYLNNWKHDFEKLKNVVTCEETTNFCIIGDLNARTGANQTFEENILVENTKLMETRKSKDSNLDGRGRILLDLLNDAGGVILNGRTPGDRNGELTFVGGMGSSVIDYCCCSMQMIKCIDDFSVVPKPFSDHMPIKLTLRVSAQSTKERKNLKLLPKLCWPKVNKNSYTAKLNELSNTGDYDNIDVDKKTELIKQKIGMSADVEHMNRKSKYTRKEKWFDFQCFKAREKVFQKLNLCRKYSSIEIFRITYINSVKNYKTLLREKRKSYQLCTIDKLNNVKDAKEWWAIAHELKSKQFVIGTHVSLNDFVVHFKQLLAPIAISPPISYAAPYIQDPLLDAPIQLDEIKLVLRHAKNGKAPGMDRIPYEFYKNAPNKFLTEIRLVLDEIFETGGIPESFKKSIIFPLFKKGDAGEVTNYRGLSFLDTIYKIFTGILLNRINNWMEENRILKECQAGFRKNYSTIDNIFNLSAIVQLKLAEKRKLYVFFVDFKSAFDTINREALFYKLFSQGMSSKLVNILKQLYKNTKSAVWNGEEVSEFFEVCTGVKQGCLLSPTLFSIYINDLCDELPGGIIFRNVLIKLLMYADDLVLIAEDAQSLQRMIDKLSVYCQRWNLMVNLQKSKIIVFRNGARRPSSERWFYNDVAIEVVNEYKYLGVIFNYNMSFNKHLDEKLIASKNAMNSSWNSFMKNKDIIPSKKVKIFEAANRSIMCYAGQVWGFKQFDQVEKLQRYFLKRMFNLPDNTPTYMIHIETGLHCLFLYTLKLHFSYIAKIMTYPTDRYPKLLAMEILEKDIYWAKEWKRLFLYANVDFDFSRTITEWKDRQKLALNNIAIKYWEENVQRARQSQFHDEYCNLQYYDVPNYFNDQNPIEMISLVFKARGGLLNINARAFKSGTVGLCTMCNLDKSENTYHFISECPILRPYRLSSFSKEILTRDEFYNLVNGKDYASLYQYLKGAIKYRNFLINEFNE